VSPELELLLAVQKLDTQLHRFNNNLEQLPRRENESQQRLIHAKSTLENHKNILTNLALNRKEGESEVEALADQERKFEGRTVEVKTNEELWALQKEIQNVQGRRSELETAVLERMEKEEIERGRLAELEKGMADAESALEQLRKEIAEERTKLEQERDTIATERESRISELRSELRTRYERVLKSTRGEAVVSLEKNACAGCLTTQPPQRIQEVRSGYLLVVCEFCGRLLVGENSSGS